MTIKQQINDYFNTTDLRKGADLCRFDSNENEFVKRVALRIVKRVYENIQKRKSTPLNETYWELIYDDGRNYSCLIPYLFENSTIAVAFDIWDILSCYSDEEIEKFLEEIDI